MSVVEQIEQEKPMFHLADRDTAFAKEGDEVNWNILRRTLSFIEEHAKGTTLETGSGASTVVFAVAGTDHTAISPVPHEHERIQDYCEGKGIPTDGLTFIPESSDVIVPSLEGSFDFILLDGTHAFPYAIVEWHYLAPKLKVGGIFVVDDVPIPAVNPLYRFLHADENWERMAILDGRTVAFRKLREPEKGSWRTQRFNDSYPDYRHLSPIQRVKATAQIKEKEFRTWAGAKKRQRL